MKRINYYDIKKLETNDDVFNYLIDTLIESIYTWDYFTQFDKCISNAEKFKKELNLLNTLLGLSEEEIEDKLISIINEHANVKKALLLLIALRPVKLKETAIINDFEILTSSNKFELFTKKDILTKEEEKLTKEINRAKGMLSNEKFVSKAPQAKVDEEKAKLEKYTQMMEQVKERLEALKAGR